MTTAQGTIAVLSWVALGSIGCAPKMKAIEGLGQTVLRGGRDALIERAGLAVIVTPLAVRLEADERITGLRIELINQSTRPVRLDWRDVLLTGGDGLKRQPIRPGDFRRYAEMAQGDPPSAYPYRSRHIYIGVGHGGWHYHPRPYGYCGPPYHYYRDYYYDDYVEQYYRRRERVARFVASLWRTQTIQPGFVGLGHVVFDYKLHKNDRVLIELAPHRLPTTLPATQPGALPTSGPSIHPLQPTQAGPLHLQFHFET
jgi:hypothetical protein